MYRAIALAASLAALASFAACSAADGAGSSDAGVLPDGAPANTLPDGAPATSTAAPLPPGTLLYVRRVAPDRDHLVARELSTGKERIVTDLRGDGSEGWSIDGFSLSPDRTKIVLSSLYGPTREDSATGLATQRIWILDVDGKNFRRLTPVFANTNPGTSGFRIDVREPSFSADGKTVYYTYGEQVGTSSGLTRIWSVPAAGGALPEYLDIPALCTIASPSSVDPKTGRVMMAQEICRDKKDDGFVFFTAKGKPTEMVLPLDTYTQGVPRWAADGSLFVFAAGAAGSTGLFAFAMDSKKVVPLVEPARGQGIMSGALAPDGSVIVYCTRTTDGRQDLHAIDLLAEPPTDRAITDDGVSCTPVL